MKRGAKLRRDCHRFITTTASGLIQFHNEASDRIYRAELKLERSLEFPMSLQTDDSYTITTVVVFLVANENISMSMRVGAPWSNRIEVWIMSRRHVPHVWITPCFYITYTQNKERERERDREMRWKSASLFLSHSLCLQRYASCPISHANDKLFNENELGNTGEVCFDYPEPRKLCVAGIYFYSFIYSFSKFWFASFEIIRKMTSFLMP